MKKIFLIASLFVATLSFANTIQPKEQEAAFLNDENSKNEKQEVSTQQKEDEAAQICTKTTLYWYQGSTYNALTDTWIDRYMVTTYVNCY